MQSSKQRPVKVSGQMCLHVDWSPFNLAGHFDQPYMIYKDFPKNTIDSNDDNIAYSPYRVILMF